MFGALHRSVTLPYLPLIILLPLSPCDYRSRAALLFSVCVSRPRPALYCSNRLLYLPMLCVAHALYVTRGEQTGA